MGQIRVAVYSSDREYTERFCSYMNEPGGEPEFYPVYSRSEMDSALSYHEVSAILTDKGSSYTYPGAAERVRTGYLTDEPSDSAEDIFKFQSRRDIARAVKRLLSAENTDVKVAAFVGAREGVGCSAAAAAFAQAMAAKDRSVLYVNMDSLGDDGCMFKRGNSRDLRYILNELVNGGDADSAISLGLNKTGNGICFFDNMNAPTALMDVTYEQMDSFFASARETGNYRYIVIDSCFALNRGVIAACREADKILIVSDGTYDCNREVDRIWKFFEESERSLCGKTEVLYNRFEPSRGEYYDNLQMREAGCIEEIPDADADQVMRSLSRETVFSNIFDKTEGSMRYIWKD